MLSHNNKYPVHLEAQVDGDASAGLTFKVFIAASTTDISATVFTGKHVTGGIAITDVEITTEAGGLLRLVVDADTDGKRIAGIVAAANGGIVKQLSSPHYCPPGVIPKLFGPATGKTRAVLHGFLYTA